MHGDGNCGFRAIAHGLFERQQNWHKNHEDLLTYLVILCENNNNWYALAAGTTFEKLKK